MSAPAFKILAVIPARGGSKGLPGKNIRPFAGLPLIAHSIRFAKMCPEISRCVVSTDSPEIAGVARAHGGDVPSLRPPELARDDTPLWPVLRHVLAGVEKADGPYDGLLLLDPTSPAREPADVSGVRRRLLETPSATGVIGVSEPDFNPLWHCVVEKDSWMSDLSPTASDFNRRQDLQVVYRINGSIYLWRAAFVRAEERSWRAHGKNVMFEIPDHRAMSIDSLEQFRKAELLVQGGMISLPWMGKGES